MLKIRYFKKNRKDLRAEPSDPSNLTQTNCTATKRSNFVAHKKSILKSKIWGDFSHSFLCDCAPSLQVVWRRH